MEYFVTMGRWQEGATRSDTHEELFNHPMEVASTWVEIDPRRRISTIIFYLYNEKTPPSVFYYNHG